MGKTSLPTLQSLRKAINQFKASGKLVVASARIIRNHNIIWRLRRIRCF